MRISKGEVRLDDNETKSLSSICFPIGLGSGLAHRHHWKKKAPAVPLRPAGASGGGLVISQPAQLIVCTNRKNYIALTNSQPLLLQRPYVKMHSHSAVPKLARQMLTK
jgi:hypothetical protein